MPAHFPACLHCRTTAGNPARVAPDRLFLRFFRGLHPSALLPHRQTQAQSNNNKTFNFMNQPASFKDKYLITGWVLVVISFAFYLVPELLDIPDSTYYTFFIFHYVLSLVYLFWSK